MKKPPDSGFFCIKKVPDTEVFRGLVALLSENLLLPGHLNFLTARNSKGGVTAREISFLVNSEGLVHVPAQRRRTQRLNSETVVKRYKARISILVFHGMSPLLLEHHKHYGRLHTTNLITSLSNIITFS